MKRKRSDNESKVRKKKSKDALASSEGTPIADNEGSPRTRILMSVPPAVEPSRSSEAVQPLAPISPVRSLGAIQSLAWLADANSSLSDQGEHVVIHKELRATESSCDNPKLAEELLDMIFLPVDRKE